MQSPNITHAGSIVWWSASAIKVDPGELRASMQRHAPEHVDLVRAPVEIPQALRRAMRRRQGAAMVEGWRWEEVSDDAAGLRVALALSERDAAAKEFRASTLFTVLVDAAGTWTMSRTPATLEEQQALTALQERYMLERGHLTSDDIRTILIKVLLERSNGVRVKDGGAVYFVPAPHDEVVARLVEPISLAGVALISYEVTSATGVQLRGEAKAGLHEEIARLHRDVAARLARVTDGRHANATALAEKLGEVETLRAKARLFKATLGMEIDGANAALAEAEALVKQTRDLLINRAAA